MPADTQGIRNRALEEHRRAERDLSQLTEALKRYHESDVPGFRAWMHTAFGQDLARHRELVREAEEKRALLLDVQETAILEGLSDVTAYRKVVWRREHPQEAEEEDRRREEADRAARQRQGGPDDPDDSPFGEPSEEEKDDTFWDGEPEDDGDPLRELFERILGIGPPDPRGRSSSPHPDGKTAKEIYRQIVRRLHPDHHGRMNEARATLWHETQEAYRRRDLNALYGILARCDDGSAAGLGQRSPVALIRRLTQQLRRAVLAARRELRTARRDWAWNYQSRLRDPRFLGRVRSHIQAMLGEARLDLIGLDGAIERLKRQAERLASRPPARRRRRPSPSPSDAQPELPF